MIGIPYTDLAFAFFIACFWWKAAELDRASPPLWLGLSLGFAIVLGSYAGFGLILSQLALFIAIGAWRVGSEYLQSSK